MVFESPDVREIRIIAKFEDYAKQGEIRGVLWLANVIKALSNPAARSVLKLADDATAGDMLAQLAKYRDISGLLRKCACDLPSALQAESHLKTLVRMPARSAWEKEAVHPTGKLDHLKAPSFCRQYWLLITVGCLLWLAVCVLAIALWMFFTDTHFEYISGWKWWAYPHGFFLSGIFVALALIVGILGKSLQYPSCRDKCIRWCCCCCCCCAFRRRRGTSDGFSPRSDGSSPRSTARSAFSDKSFRKSRTSYFSWSSREEGEPELDEVAIRKEMNLPEGYDLSLVAPPPDMYSITVAMVSPKNQDLGNMLTSASSEELIPPSEGFQPQDPLSRLTYVEEELRREAENALAQESLMCMPSPHEAVDAREEYSPRTEGYIAALEPTLCYYDFSAANIATLVKQCHHDDVELRIAMANIVQDGGAAKIKEVSEPPTMVSTCRVCGKTYPRGAMFCRECGAHEEDPEYPHPHGGVKPIYISGSIAALWHDPSYSYASRFQHQSAKAAAEAAKEPGKVKTGPVTQAQMKDAQYHLKRMVVDQPQDGLVEEMRPHMKNFAMMTMKGSEPKYPNWHPDSKKSKEDKDELVRVAMSKKTKRLNKPIIPPLAPKPTSVPEATSVTEFLRQGEMASPSSSSLRGTQPLSLSSLPDRCVGLAHPSTFTELERQHRFFAFSGGSQNSWSTDLEGQREPQMETVTASQNDDDMSLSPPPTPASPLQRKVGFNDDSDLLPSPVSSVSGLLRATANPGTPDSRSPYPS